MVPHENHCNGRNKYSEHIAVAIGNRGSVFVIAKNVVTNADDMPGTATNNFPIYGRNRNNNSQWADRQSAFEEAALPLDPGSIYGLGMPKILPSRHQLILGGSSGLASAGPQVLTGRRMLCY